MKSHVPITAQPLPYPLGGLRSFGIPPEDVAEHYGKHHCHYASQLERLVAADSSLCAIVDRHDFQRRRLGIIQKEGEARRQKQQQQQQSTSEKKKEEGGDAASAITTAATAPEATFGSSTVGAAGGADDEARALEAALNSTSPLTSAEALMLSVPRSSHAGNLASMVVNHDFFWRCWRGTEEGGPSERPEEAHRCGHDHNHHHHHGHSSNHTSFVAVGPETTSYAVRSRHPSLAALLTYIERDFGSVKALQRTFEKAALSLFGSGWVWLAWSRGGGGAKEGGGRLVVLATRDSVNPLTLEFTSAADDVSATEMNADKKTSLTHGQAVRKAGYVPLLGCDMWEHAYLVHGGASSASASALPTPASYLSGADKEKRNYLRKFWEAANWEFAAGNFSELAMVGGPNAPTPIGGSHPTSVPVAPSAGVVSRL